MAWLPSNFLLPHQLRPAIVPVHINGKLLFKLCVLSFILLTCVFGIIYFNTHEDAPPPVNQEKHMLTMVTAYFNLGPHQKGVSGKRTPQQYFSQLKLFRRFCFPLVVFSDNLEIIRRLETIRSELLHYTKLIFIENRTSLWSFAIENRIKSIYRQPYYPIHHPNTVISTYSSIMHSKFDLLEKTILNDIMPSDFLGWMDLGYFREVNPAYESCLIMRLPPKFDIDKVAYNQITPFTQMTTKKIVEDNEVWVGGGFILGERGVLRQHVKEYKTHVEWMLGENLMSTDQQVLYSMFQNKSRHQIDIQTYDSHLCLCDNWFYLGYLCLRHKCAGFNQD